MTNFDHIRNWVFDLDHTLYPPEINLFQQIDKNMTAFIMEYFGLERKEAHERQKRLYWTYGTTLNGLMTEYKVKADDFLKDVHKLDLSEVNKDLPLREQLQRITEKNPDNQRIIYTNGTKRHAKNVSGALGIDDLFPTMIGIRETNFVPKPETEAFDRFFDMTKIDPKTSIMFEDMAVNLIEPKKRGMITVLIEPTHTTDEENKWAYKGSLDHVDYKTKDLTGFLKQHI